MKKRRTQTKHLSFFNLIKPLILLTIIIILINIPSKKFFTHKSSSDNNSVVNNLTIEHSKSPSINNINKNTAIVSNTTMDNLNNAEFFKHSLFFGDSIIESMSFYDALPEKNVLGIKGLSVYTAFKQLNKILEYNPNKIFILLGNNDLFNEKLTSNNFIDGYSKLIDKIKFNLPNCQIYVMSILPVTKKAEKKYPFLNKQRIDVFNSDLIQMCKVKDLSYLNIIPVLNYSEKYFEPDGIHPVCEFYNKLLKYLRTQYIKNN